MSRRGPGVTGLLRFAVSAYLLAACSGAEDIPVELQVWTPGPEPAAPTP